MFNSGLIATNNKKLASISSWMQQIKAASQFKNTRQLMCFSSWLQQTQGKSQSLLCYHTVIVLDLPLVDQSFSTLTGGSSGYGDESVSPYKHRSMVEGCSDYDPFTVDSAKATNLDLLISVPKEPKENKL